MAASTIKYSALGTTANLILGAGVAPTAKALANNGQKLGSEVDGSTNRNTLGDFVLRWRGASAPSAGGYVALYLIQAVDGTNYQDGDDSVAPPATAFAGNFPVRAVTTQQVVALRGIALPATKWKALIVNKTGQAATNTDAENYLDYRPYDPEAQ